MSKTKTEDQKNNRRDIELPPNVTAQMPVEHDEPSEAEKMLEASRPYWGQIALGVCALLLGYVLLTYFMQNSQNAAAEPWQQLDRSINQFRINQNVDSLKQMENDFPNDKATNFALQIAGDYEMNRGLQQLPVDREGGIKLIKRAKESFQKVYDAPNTTKTVMQQRRSLYTLAYAAESLGEFDEAKTLYSKYTEEAPDSVLFKDAQRGLARVSNPEFVSLYSEFTDHKPFDEEAPGAAVEDAPNIEFPEIDIPQEMEETKESSDDSSENGGAFEASPKAQPPATKEESKPAATDEGNTDEAAAPVMPEGDASAETVAPAVTTSEGVVDAIKDAEPAVTTIKEAVDAAVEPAATTGE